MKQYNQVYRSINDLIPYVSNSRTHDERQIDQVAESIKEFGFTNPILIDEDNGVIAGHGRLLASKKLKLDEVPCIVLDGLSEAQRKAYVIADNKLALNSDWDYTKLTQQLEEISQAGFELPLLGFSDGELETLLGGEIDLSILDELDDEDVDELESNVKKAIQIEFEADDYERAKELIAHFRNQGAYVGYMIIHHLESQMK